MNDDTVKFIKDRYVVLRNVIPKEIITFALDTWKTIEAYPESQAVIFDEEKEPIPEVLNLHIILLRVVTQHLWELQCIGGYIKN